MKKCPFCAEEIQDEAIKCKHCGEFLNKSALIKHGAHLKPKEDVKWYYRNTAWLVGFLCAGPLAIPLVWINPKLNLFLKIVISMGMIVVTWFLVIAVAHAVGSIKEYYDLLQGLY